MARSGPAGDVSFGGGYGMGSYGGGPSRSRSRSPGRKTSTWTLGLEDPLGRGYFSAAPMQEPLSGTTYAPGGGGGPGNPALARIVKMAGNALPGILMSAITGNPMPAVGMAIASILGITPTQVLGYITQGLLGKAPTEIGFGMPVSGTQIGMAEDSSPVPTRTVRAPQPISASAPIAPAVQAAPAVAPTTGASTNVAGTGGAGYVGTTGEAVKRLMTPQAPSPMDLSRTTLSHAGRRKLKNYPSLESGYGIY